MIPDLVRQFNNSIYGRAFANVTGIKYVSEHYLAPFLKEKIGPYEDYWRSPRGQYEARAMLYEAFPVLRHNENMERMDRGLALYGLTYDDIHYTGGTLGVGNTSGAVRGSFNFFSDNVKELYR